MSHLNLEPQNDLLEIIDPPQQHQSSMNFQKHKLEKQLSYLQNSFISEQNRLQKSKQNIKISDHFQLHHKNQELQKQIPMERQQERNNQNQNQSIQQKHKQQDLRKESYSIIQEQNSNEKNYETQRLQQMSQYPSSSHFDQQQAGCITQGSSRKKNFIENLELTHKEQMTLGTKILSGLQKNIVSLPFRQPVDIVKLNIPDYPEIIKQPMDLRSIKRKLSQDNYLNLNQIYADIQLIISNSMKYNELNPDFIRLTRNFEKSYNKIRRDCERQFRKLKNAQEKNNQQNKTVVIEKKVYKSFETDQTLNEVEIQSTYDFTELAKLAKRIRKLLPEEQIELFKKIGIQDTLTIDIKTLTTKQVKLLLKEVEKLQTVKNQIVMVQQKKQNSHLTTCESESRTRT